MIVGIISIALAVVGITFSMYNPPRKKLLWIGAVWVVGAVAILLLYLEQSQAQHSLLNKRFSLEPRHSKVVEIPVAASDQKRRNEEILIPFRADIGDDQVTIRMYVHGQDITKRLLEYMAVQEKSKYRETTEGELVVYPGTIFFNIPFKVQNIISSRALDVVVDLIQRGEEKDTVRNSYEVNLNPWEFRADFSKHDLATGEPVRLLLTINNHGTKGRFRVFSELRRDDGRIIESPPLKDRTEFEVNMNGKYELQEDISIPSPGKYIVAFGVIKQFEYLDLAANHGWKNAYLSKKYYFTVNEPTLTYSNSNLDETEPRLDGLASFSESDESSFRFTKTLDIHAQEYGVQVYDLIYWNHEKIKSPERIPRGAEFRIPEHRPKPPFTWLLRQTPLYDDMDGEQVGFLDKREDIFILDTKGDWYKVLTADGRYRIGWTNGKHWP